MFSKKQRVNSTLFKEVFETGSKKYTPDFFLSYVKKSPDGLVHIAVVAPKKIQKQAIKRNAMRRKAYAYMRTITLPTEGVYIVVYKKNDASLECIKDLFNQI